MGETALLRWCAPALRCRRRARRALLRFCAATRGGRGRRQPGWLPSLRGALWRRCVPSLRRVRRAAVAAVAAAGCGWLACVWVLGGSIVDADRFAATLDPSEYLLVGNGSASAAVLALETRPGVFYAHEMDKAAYCRRHGFDFAFFRQRLDRTRRAKWSKLIALRLLLGRYRYVAWMDSDTLIYNHLVSFVPYVDGVDMVFQTDLFKKPQERKVNSGIFVARSSPWTMTFLARVYDQWQCELGYGIVFDFVDQCAFGFALAGMDETELRAHVLIADYNAIWFNGNAGYIHPIVRGRSLCPLRSPNLSWAAHWPNCMKWKANDCMTLYNMLSRHVLTKFVGKSMKDCGAPAESYHSFRLARSCADGSCYNLRNVGI